MNVDLIWSKDAELDVTDLYFKLAATNQPRAEEIARRIASSIKLLLLYPRMGVGRPSHFAAARVLIERPYLILYRTYPDTDDGPIETVEIIRVAHGASDLRQLARYRLPVKKPSR